jgi:hypothetical protein
LKAFEDFRLDARSTGIEQIDNIDKCVLEDFYTFGDGVARLCLDFPK